MSSKWLWTLSQNSGELQGSTHMHWSVVPIYRGECWKSGSNSSGDGDDGDGDGDDVLTLLNH